MPGKANGSRCSRLSRRAFLGLAASLALPLWGCSGAIGSSNLSDFLVMSSADCLERLEGCGWTENYGQTLWNHKSASIGPYTGAATMALLGHEKGWEGRLIGAERLADNASVQAVSVLLDFPSGLPCRALDMVTRMRSALGISSGSILKQQGHTLRVDMSLPPERIDRFAPAYEVGSLNIQSEPAVWTCTTDGVRFMSIGLAFLSYYAESQLVDASYDAISQTDGPWDIDIQREFRKE